MPDALINGHKCRIISRPCLRLEVMQQADGSYAPGRAHRLPICICGERGTVGRSELIEAWLDAMPWGEPDPAVSLDTLIIVIDDGNWTFDRCAIKPVSGGVMLYYERCRYDQSPRRGLK